MITLMSVAALPLFDAAWGVPALPFGLMSTSLNGSASDAPAACAVREVLRDLSPFAHGGGTLDAVPAPPMTITSLPLLEPFEPKPVVIRVHSIGTFAALAPSVSGRPGGALF